MLALRYAIIITKGRVFFFLFFSFLFLCFFVSATILLGESKSGVLCMKVAYIVGLI